MPILFFFFLFGEVITNSELSRRIGDQQCGVASNVKHASRFLHKSVESTMVVSV